MFDTSHESATVPRPALWLGFAGLLPFAGLALALWISPEIAINAATINGVFRVEPMLLGYGAIIISFMAGCRWGFAAAGMGRGPTYADLGISTVPAMFAWVVLPIGGPVAMALIAIAFLWQLLDDIALTRAGGAPPWWSALRIPLASGAAISLFAGAAALI